MAIPGEDCAAECDHRRADLLADLDYRRLPHEIWRGRPGAEVLVSAMADLIAENERHLVAIEQLWRRFDDLSQNHVYFEVDEASQTVYVLAIWGAPRGRSPKL